MKLIKSLSLVFMLVLGMQSLALARADVVQLYTDAVMLGDVQELEKILAPNYWHIGSNGHIQDKNHFIQAIKNKELVVERLTFTNVRESSLGQTRLLTGNGMFKGYSALPRPQGLMRYTMVTAMNNGKEEVVLFQATPVIPTDDCKDGNCRIK